MCRWCRSLFERHQRQLCGTDIGSVAKRLAKGQIEREQELVDRREFLRTAAGAAIASQTNGLFANIVESRSVSRSLVPDQPSSAPNYWCTWAAQNYMYGHGLANLDPKMLEGESGSKLAHDAMSERVLFGDGGWANNFFPKIRKDLYLLLDDGWQAGGTATFELDTVKFPAFTGSFETRLRKLNSAIEEAGWRSTALWCRNTPGGDADQSLVNRSESAAIKYWKIDLGDPTFNLVRLRDEKHAPLILEHVHGEIAVNGDWSKDGRFGVQQRDSRRLEILRHTDVYRTYDVTSILSLPTTLDRLAEMLKGGEGDTEVHGLINVEDEVYVAAALGCTMGIMRHPLTGLRPGEDADLFFNGPRQPKRRMDEVVRATRWQRIAAPFSPGIGSVKISDEILTDTWTFDRGETWQSEIVGATVRQGAPACIARNIGLPEVKAKGEKPFVWAARFPNGAVAIAAQERTQVGNAWYMPVSEVTLSVSDAPGPFGVFGSFDELTLNMNRSLVGKRIIAQDLAGDEALDITNQVQVQEKSLRISGQVIRRVGLENATKNDLSAPGLVIAIL
jgi:hypothetical protein